MIKSMNSEIAYKWWGTQSYSKSLKIQKKNHSDRVSDQIKDSIMFLEHYPVITIGRTGSEKDIISDFQKLAESRIEVVHSNRGGETTFHGPGQLIGYLFIKIKNRGFTPISYVRLLEKILVLSFAEFGLETMTLKGKTGVWVKRKNYKKIAAIGVRISKGVTMHGFSANISNDLSQFDHIIPCGMPGLESTSLKKELAQNIELVDFSRNVLNNFIKELSRKK
jgi:lipoate-protein ligase B